MMTLSSNLTLETFAKFPLAAAKSTSSIITRWWSNIFAGVGRRKSSGSDLLFLAVDYGVIPFLGIPNSACSKCQFWQSRTTVSFHHHVRIMDRGQRHSGVYVRTQAAMTGHFRNASIFITFGNAFIHSHKIYTREFSWR